MLNPMMDLVKELKSMHEDLTKRLDKIISKLDQLVDLEKCSYEFETRNHGDDPSS